MEFKILGSGGAFPTPRAFCQCEICVEARSTGKNKRNSSCFFIKDINGLVDCPEDINDSLNSHFIEKVEHVFITHFHPDHTFGLRVLLESVYDYYTKTQEIPVNVYMAENVYESLKKIFLAEFLFEIKKKGNLIFIKNNETVHINNTIVTAVGYQGDNSEVYAFLFEKDNQKALYAPCDTIKFERSSEFINLDLLVNEIGIFSHDICKKEISFPDLMTRLENMKPKRIILTHIEECELRKWGLEHLENLKKKYPQIPFVFAHDGLDINI